MRVTEIRDLDVVFDYQLTFKKHIEIISVKAVNIYGMGYRFSRDIKWPQSNAHYRSIIHNADSWVLLIHMVTRQDYGRKIARTSTTAPELHWALHFITSTKIIFHSNTDLWSYHYLRFVKEEILRRLWSLSKLCRVFTLYRSSVSSTINSHRHVVHRNTRNANVSDFTRENNKPMQSPLRIGMTLINKCKTLIAPFIQTRERNFAV